MPRMRSRRIAAVSGAILLLAATLSAARRPHYGATLVVETQGRVTPATDGAPASQGLLPDAVLGQVYETLVRVDSQGRVRLCLAVEWKHDDEKHRWVFTPRSSVRWHDGSAWTPTEAQLSFPDDQPIEKLLRELARPERAFALKTDAGWVGTGPYKIAQWDRDTVLRLEAFDDHWQGRPYLDQIEVRMRKPLRDQWIDFEARRVQVAEVALPEARRTGQRGVRVVTSRPNQTLAIVFLNNKLSPDVRRALGLAIDRAAIQRVLLDRQGEAAAALLPGWLSGYSFLFPPTRDVAKARAMGRNAVLNLGVEGEEPWMRAVADRIAVNATEAGLTVKVNSGAPDARLMKIEIPGSTASAALMALAARFGVKPASGASEYDVEKTLLDDGRIVPLSHLPQVFALSPSLYGWTADWRFDEMWLEPGGAQ